MNHWRSYIVSKRKKKKKDNSSTKGHAGTMVVDKGTAIKFRVRELSLLGFCSRHQRSRLDVLFWYNQGHQQCIKVS